MRKTLSIILCCLGLVGTMPALSAEQTVEVYKNAN
jgi:hypothetical protein